MVGESSSSSSSSSSSDSDGSSQSSSDDSSDSSASSEGSSSSESSDGISSDPDSSGDEHSGEDGSPDAARGNFEYSEEMMPLRKQNARGPERLGSYHYDARRDDGCLALSMVEEAGEEAGVSSDDEENPKLPMLLERTKSRRKSNKSTESQDEELRSDDEEEIQPAKRTFQLPRRQSSLKIMKMAIEEVEGGENSLLAHSNHEDFSSGRDDASEDSSSSSSEVEGEVVRATRQASWRRKVIELETVAEESMSLPSKKKREIVWEGEDDVSDRAEKRAFRTKRIMQRQGYRAKKALE
mmetsp:Transcript_989/g.2373  ORF Transcript_989/g.2373 Transcript_989/m.2373 type:complete len:296 (+) Transcript_989:327-1214(+)